jgi:hypothetical protein
MLSFRPFGRRGAVKLSNARRRASSFLKNFGTRPSPVKWVFSKTMTTLLAYFGGKVVSFDTQQGRAGAVLVQLFSCD